VSQVRIVEVLAALSLTTDLASGVPFEKGLRTCVVADALAAVMGLDSADRRVVYQSALLRAVGCTSHASENAAMFADDVAFQAALKNFDPGDPVVRAAQLKEFGAWAGAGAGGVLAQRFMESFHTVGPQAARAGCEVSRALGPGLGLAPAAVEALDDVYERWDGLGLPAGRAGERISLAARTVHVSEQVVLAHAHGGRGAALAEVRRRAGGHLDPDLVALVVANADAVLAPLEVPDVLAAVVSSEPGPTALVPTDQLDRLCLSLATVADLKGTHLIGHSTHVADVAEAAGRLAGLPTADLRAAALLHDIGRVGVSSAVWDRAGPLGAAEWERVRLHTYWTDRVLRRCPALAPLAAVASAHHERQTGDGYHRGIRSSDLPPSARLLAAADVLAALTEPRPYRPALPLVSAARTLAGMASAGHLDPDACGAVIEAAGLPRPRSAWPCDLSDREVEVLRLAARGLSNREIASELTISERTVGHHLAHVYDKTGRRTRAGAAVFAIEHGLLPAGPAIG
jgi:HD-GYP domain-containing protein (c-di-GMP phosphodiesterase class II)/DNA-binding CsgD family transcriptional regulator